MDLNAPECDASGKSKLTSTASECSPSTGQTSVVGQTSARSLRGPARCPTVGEDFPRDHLPQTSDGTPHAKPGASTSSVEDSPARMSALPSTTPLDSTAIAAGSGLSLRESLAFFDLESSLWRTRQGCLFGGLVEFSEDWQNSGLMLNGELYRRVPLVDHTCESGCSYWATPRKSRRGVTKDKGRPGGGCRCLETDLANRGHTGPVNPTWQEWLMGFPEGWTDVEPVATP